MEHHRQQNSIARHSITKREAHRRGHAPIIDYSGRHTVSICMQYKQYFRMSVKPNTQDKQLIMPPLKDPISPNILFVATMAQNPEACVTTVSA
jgi:hypothetical protein